MTTTTKRKGGGTIRTVSFSGDAMRAIEATMPKDGNFSGFVCRCILVACANSKTMKIMEYEELIAQLRPLAAELYHKEVVLA